MPLKLTAIHLHRFMSSGRNNPTIFGCIDTAGKVAGDYVVKLCGAMDTGIQAAARELIASLLAEHFGVLRPNPATIEIHPELLGLLAIKKPDIAHLLGKRGDLNFGSQLIVGAAEWLPGRTLPDAMVHAATRIFAFDALISNDDRRYNKPNVLVRGDDIFAIDQEAAFSFLYLVSTVEKSWVAKNRRSLTDHVFYYQLRKKPVDLGIFAARLAQLSAGKLEAIIQ